MSKRRPKRIGYLAFDGMQSLDLFGPFEAFQEANDLAPGKRAKYENLILSRDGRPVTSSSGATIAAHASLDACPPLHTLIIPGGRGARGPEFPGDVIAWIRSIAPGVRRLGSVCTGLFILARTGLIAGKRVTTHWEHVAEARSRFPDLDVAADELFIRSGKIFTAAGVTSGIDLALALIEDDLGPAVATRVARHLVVFVKRPGDQRQYSSILRHQAGGGDEFAELIAWASDNLAADLSSFALSERMGLSERQFRRRFHQVFGETPTRHIERLRIETACDWLATDAAAVATIARDVGYDSSDTFRRAFERLKGVAPSAYRARFGRSPA